MVSKVARTWEDSRERCKKWEGDLVSAKKVKNLDLTRKGYWVGEMTSSGIKKCGLLRDT